MHCAGVPELAARVPAVIQWPVCDGGTLMVRTTRYRKSGVFYLPESFQTRDLLYVVDG